MALVRSRYSQFGHTVFTVRLASLSEEEAQAGKPFPTAQRLTVGINSQGLTVFEPQGKTARESFTYNGEQHCRALLAALWAHTDDILYAGLFRHREMAARAHIRGCDTARHELAGHPTHFVAGCPRRMRGDFCTARRLRCCVPEAEERQTRAGYCQEKVKSPIPCVRGSIHRRANEGLVRCFLPPSRAFARPLVGRPGASARSGRPALRPGRGGP
mgnify:CR=1 FL=1|jgi:hypothetical protein